MSILTRLRQLTTAPLGLASPPAPAEPTEPTEPTPDREQILIDFLGDPATIPGQPLAPGALADYAITSYLRSTPVIPDYSEFIRRLIAWGALRRTVVHGFPLRTLTDLDADPWNM